MTDHLSLDMTESAFDEAELLDISELGVPAAVVRSKQVRFARSVSNVLAPACVSIPMIFLVAFYRATNPNRAMFYALITLFFLSIGPFIYILIGVRLGKLSDVDVSKRSERVGPFIFGLISICAGWLALNLLHGPRGLIAILMITVLSGLVMMLITLWWKISLHASSMAAVATILTVFYGVMMLPLFALLVLVSWSRVVLRRHTPAQVVAGSLMGIALCTLLLKLQGF